MSDSTAPARYPLQYSVVCCDLLHDTNVPPVSDWEYTLLPLLPVPFGLKQALYPLSYACTEIKLHLSV